jgi:hypothetical protein
MPILENNHNANLLSTLPDNAPVVKFIERDEDGVGVVYHQELAPEKLFVKIANTIFNYILKPRLLEFYCLFCYFVYAHSNTKLSNYKIIELIYHYTHFSMSKNTVGTYMNKLIELGLVIRFGQYYSIGYCDVGDIDCNQYLEPKGNYTNFFITAYNNNTKKGSMALEFYMASKFYKRHRPNKVTKDLNISPRTYYTYLKDIIKKQIVVRTRVNYQLFYYTNSYRQTLWEEYIEIKDARYYYKGYHWREAKKTKQPTAHSRLWFASPMARIMKEYKINYTKSFESFDPRDAYAICKELEDQYRSSSTKLNAAILVRGILDAYNWTKIQDRKHAKLKRTQRNHEIYMSYPENFVNEMMS